MGIVYHNITNILLIIRFLESILMKQLPTTSTLKMEGSGFSEILVPTYKIELYHPSYVWHILTHRRVNLLIAQYLCYR
jgi:hypothetical protein